MTEFIKRFKQNGDYSLCGMRKAAISLLPTDRDILDALYEDLNRGRDVLEDEDLLNMYLYSYGKMHKFKLVKAFVSLLEQVDFHNEEIEIYDWGCGQGIATVCLLDMLRYCEVRPCIKKIYLVDKSYTATNRAYETIECIMPQCEVETIAKDINYLNKSDFAVSNVKKIHLFSNILDVDSYDLLQFVRLFNKVFSGDNYVVCVGPCYNRGRLDEFINSISPDIIFSSVDFDRGEWLNDWSISLRICYKSNPCLRQFESITIDMDYLSNENISLSPIREASTSDGKVFNYYWVSFENTVTGNSIICCTGKKFTELLGNNADKYKLIEKIKANEGRFEIAQATDDDGEPIYVNDDLSKPLLKIQAVLCPWIDNFGAKYSRDWTTLLSGPCRDVVKSMVINSQNFKKTDMWVSKPIKSNKTGKTVYWCSFHSFENGILIYLSSEVWKGLSEVNSDTLWEVFSKGKYSYIIREARDIETDEWLMDNNDQPIMKIQETHHYAHLDWNGEGYSSCKELNEVEKYSIKSGTTSIKDYAFSCSKSLQVITIPDSVERVGRDIFKGCDSLKSIIIPNGTLQKYSRLLPDYVAFLVEDISSDDDFPF